MNHAAAHGGVVFWLTVLIYLLAGIRDPLQREQISLMKPTASPLDLFFNDLRDILSMKIQLLEALHRLVGLASDRELHDVINLHLLNADFQRREIVEIFARFRKSPGCEDCKAIRGLIESGETSLKAMNHLPTRDLKIIAHGLRICHYGTASYEITCRLAERLFLLREASTLRRSLTEQSEATRRLMDLEARIFCLANSPANETPYRSSASISF